MQSRLACINSSLTLGLLSDFVLNFLPQNEGENKNIDLLQLHVYVHNSLKKKAQR